MNTPEEDRDMINEALKSLKTPDPVNIKAIVKDLKKSAKIIAYEKDDNTFLVLQAEYDKPHPLISQEFKAEILALELRKKRVREYIKELEEEDRMRNPIYALSSFLSKGPTISDTLDRVIGKKKEEE